jgi:hypothetical protein
MNYTVTLILPAIVYTQQYEQFIKQTSRKKTREISEDFGRGQNWFC